jgi:hypothetical protein
MIRTIILLTLIALTVSCSSNLETFSPQKKKAVEDSVLIMAEKIAKDVSKEGPVAWLRYFENSSDFFMASNGQLVFANYDSAKNIVNNTLVKSIAKIELRWSNIRIDPLTSGLAGMAANFHEDITDANGSKVPADGYFTAIAEQTSRGWKLRNAHWSIKATN